MRSAGYPGSSPRSKWPFEAVRDLDLQVALRSNPAAARTTTASRCGPVRAKKRALPIAVLFISYVLPPGFKKSEFGLAALRRLALFALPLVVRHSFIPQAQGTVS